MSSLPLSLTPKPESGGRMANPVCCRGGGQVAKLSGVSERVRKLEQDLTSARIDLAAKEEGLKQATLRLEKADARAKVGWFRAAVAPPFSGW